MLATCESSEAVRLLLLHREERALKTNSSRRIHLESDATSMLNLSPLTISFCVSLLLSRCGNEKRMKGKQMTNSLHPPSCILHIS
jgi:hypothetical protein